jgi:hypothetical protein
MMVAILVILVEAALCGILLGSCAWRERAQRRDRERRDLRTAQLLTAILAEVQSQRERDHA